MLSASYVKRIWALKAFEAELWLTRAWESRKMFIRIHAWPIRNGSKVDIILFRILRTVGNIFKWPYYLATEYHLNWYQRKSFCAGWDENIPIDRFKEYSEYFSSTILLLQFEMSRALFKCLNSLKAYGSIKSSDIKHTNGIRKSKLQLHVMRLTAGESEKGVKRKKLLTGNVFTECSLLAPNADGIWSVSFWGGWQSFSAKPSLVKSKKKG